jgi:hypothetical protein
VADPVYQTHALDEDAPAEPVTLDRFAHSRAVAEYVGDMIGQLESMSRLAGFDLLVYLLSMARAEAESNARARDH